MQHESQLSCCQQGADKAPAKAAATDAEPEVDLLDLRVGKILSIDRHPNAESLYVEQIDLGEEQPRQVGGQLLYCSGPERLMDSLMAQLGWWAV